MKFVLTFAFAFLLMGCDYITPDKNPTFANIEWGSSIDDAKENLKKLGYKCSTVDSKHIKFTGDVAGEEIVGHVVSTDAGVGRVVLFFSHFGKSYNLSERFFTIRDKLVENYGEPDEEDVLFSRGEAATDAVRTAIKGSSTSRWFKDTRGGELSVKMTSSMLAVAYESRKYEKNRLEEKVSL